jgi:hypothetical protein
MNRLKLESLQGLLSNPLDLFLCSSSFEARCATVADSIDFSNIQHVAIARNENLLPYLEKNAKYLAAKNKHMLTELLFDTDNPLKAADQLRNLFFSHFQGDPKKTLIDVSTFTHEALLITLRAVQSLARSIDVVQFVYVPAQEYSIGNEDGDKWLSKGIREIRSVIGYPGELLPSRKIHLIVLVGFETERARALVEAYEPSLITLGYGTEVASTSKKNFTANELFHKKMVALFPKSKSFNFAPNNFSETAAALKAEVARHPEHNVVIAPLNTKLSTVGSALAAISDEAIQLCYAQAELYNFEHYSIPADSFYLFSIPGIGVSS